MKPADESTLPGPLGDYVPVRVLARGGQGIVYEVRSLSSGAPFAAKQLLKLDERGLARFRREALLLARCDRHPGVVKVHAAGELPDGSPYMILDLVTGEPLDALLRREGRLEPARAAGLARKIALALGHVHALGVVHRDVKPGNVILDEGGEPRLTDFGLAVSEDVERLTRSGAFLGTPQYLAPEQARSGHTVGPAADVFSLGCVLFHLLAGEVPLPSQQLETLLAQLVGSDEPLRDVRSVEPGVPAPLAAVVAWALERDPAARPADGNELARALDEAISGRMPRGRGPRSRRPLHVALGALVLGSIGVLALALGSPSREARRELAAARRSLEQARATAARKGLPDDWREGLGRATDALSRARRSVALGNRDAGSVATEASKLASELALLGAGRELERGDPASALAMLAAVPSESVSDSGWLLHVRALLGVGRLGDAANEAAAVAKRAPPGLVSEALELEGDACVASSVAIPRAILAYTHALAAKTRRATELLEKRACAEALGGDDVSALADLARAWPPERALALPPLALARLAPVAPALYRRALAAPDDAARERDLELAIRIGPAPEGVAREAARAWLRICITDSTYTDFQQAFVAHADREDETRRSVERGVVALERAARARTIDPGASLDGYRSLLNGLLGGFRFRFSVTGTTPAWLAALEERLFVAWPEDPFVVLVAAGSESEAVHYGERLNESAKRLPGPLDGDDDLVVRSLAETILTRWLGCASGPESVELLTRVVTRAGTSAAWSHAGELYHRCRAHDLEPGALETARRTRQGAQNAPGILKSEAFILMDEKRYPEAVARARELNALDPGATEAVGTVLLVCHGEKDVVELFAKRDDFLPGCYRVQALARLDRFEEARALLAELARRPNDHPDLLRAAAAEVTSLEKARREGK